MIEPRPPRPALEREEAARQLDREAAAGRLDREAVERSCRLPATSGHMAARSGRPV